MTWTACTGLSARCGRRTVARALVGLARIDAGEIRLGGQPAPKNPTQAARMGVALVPEDRKAYGLLLSHSLRFNLTLPNLGRLLRWGLLLLRRREAPLVDGAVHRLQIRAPSPEAAVE